jgi:hypothetical protein
MPRLCLLLLALNLTASAQMPPVPDYLPISGRVLNAVTEAPIAGAKVHFRGTGGVSDGHGTMVSPPSMQGEVTTAPDGSYTIPNLPSFGDFQLRGSAPGFLSGSKWLQAVPESLARDIVPTEPGYKGPPMLMNDTTVRLEPDPLNLQHMTDAALATLRAYAPFAPSVFSPDGAKFAFTTLSRPHMEWQAPGACCLVWTYDIAKGNLTSAALPQGFSDGGEPIYVRGVVKGVVRGVGDYVPSMEVAWEDTLYVTMVKPVKDAPAEIRALALRGSGLMPIALNELPQSIRASFAARAGLHRVIPPSADMTKDGLYSIQETESGGRSICATVFVVSTRTKMRRTVGGFCPGSGNYGIDYDRDLAFYTDGGGQGGGFRKLTELDMKTGVRQSFKLPMMNREPSLGVTRALPDGSTRMAYTIGGDCNPAESDYSQPFQPDGVLGQTPNQFSVCLITIPPPAAKPVLTAVRKTPAPRPVHIAAKPTARRTGN